MKEKPNKSQSASLLKKLTDVETNVNYNGDFVEMNVMGKLIQKKEQEISLKSIYELMTTFKMEVNQKFDSLENEIHLVKRDVKNLNIEINTIKQDVKKIDNKLNDVIELNNLKVSKNNKAWSFSNNNDNTPSR